MEWIPRDAILLKIYSDRGILLSSSDGDKAIGAIFICVYFFLGVRNFYKKVPYFVGKLRRTN